jgi:hypothetical protein
MEKLHDMRKESAEKMCGPTYENGYWRKKTNKKIIRNLNLRMFKLKNGD